MTNASFPLFKEWPKIVRHENRRKPIFTEKIDGTNACVIVTTDGDLFCQSRTRLITPEDDNFGFANWAYGNKQFLVDALGPGYHFGEWWGQKIQRTYGLDEKRFSLFNTRRWNEHNPPPDGLHVVPILPVTTAEQAVTLLKEQGSLAVPGWMRPEGAVMLDLDTDTRFKIIIDK